MPLRPENPILKVEFGSMRTIDTSSAENLFGLWSVFSRCASSMQDGKRYENLSWRLWNRETFCCAPDHSSTRFSPRWAFAHPTPAATTKPCLTTASRRAEQDLSVPDLVPSSVESDSSDEGRSEAASARLRYPSQPDITALGTRSRGKEPHITPVDLEKIVISIKDKQALEPLSPLPRSLAPPLSSTVHPENTTPTPRPVSPLASATIPESSTSTVATIALTDASNMSPVVGSSTSTATDMSSHSIVRGFEPGRISSSFRSKTQLNNSHTPTSMLQQVTPNEQPEHMKKKGATFTIGGGSSDEEVESSLETHMRAASNCTKASTLSKKTAAFKDEVTLIAEANDSSAIESDDEDGVSESAIEDEDEDDDDDDAWEDSSDNGDANSEEKQPTTFERVESTVNLPSRRSLLTMQMHEPQSHNSATRSTPALRRSRTSTPNGPSLATSPQEAPLEIQVAQATRSRPIIMTTSNTHPPALSPRTTRRNMLSTELTESLRKNLLWERQQKNSTSNAAAAAIKRRHTSNDVRNLNQFPDVRTGRLPTVRETNKGINSWNHYFDNGLQEYHEKGW